MILGKLLESFRVLGLPITELLHAPAHHTLEFLRVLITQTRKSLPAALHHVLFQGLKFFRMIFPKFRSLLMNIFFSFIHKPLEGLRILRFQLAPLGDFLLHGFGRNAARLSRIFRISGQCKTKEKGQNSQSLHIHKTRKEEKGLAIGIAIFRLSSADRMKILSIKGRNKNRIGFKGFRACIFNPVRDTFGNMTTSPF